MSSKFQDVQCDVLCDAPCDVPCDVIYTICKYIKSVRKLISIQKLLPYKLSRQDLYRIVRNRFRGNDNISSNDNSNSDDNADNNSKNNIIFKLWMCEFLDTCINGSVDEVKEIIDVLDIGIYDINLCGEAEPWHLRSDEEIYYYKNILLDLIHKMRPDVIKLLIEMEFIPICACSVFEFIKIGDIDMLDYWIGLVDSKGKKYLLHGKQRNIYIYCVELGNIELFNYFIKYFDMDDTSKMSKIFKESGYNFLTIAIMSKNVSMVKLLVTKYDTIRLSYYKSKNMYDRNALLNCSLDILTYLTSLPPLASP